MQPSVLVSIPSLSKAFGGPSRTVYSLWNNLTALGAQGHILTSSKLTGDEQFKPGGTTVSDISGCRINVGRSSWSPSLKKRFFTAAKDIRPDIIHNHGIWMQANHIASLAARKLNIPLITSIHGMLTEWAFSYKAWKKKAAWIAYQKHDLSTASILHITGMHELDFIRRLGIKTPICIIPYGVDLPDMSLSQKISTAYKTALFMGRIHPVKGLDMLIEAWSIARPPGWKLVLAGPDEGGYKARLESIIAEYNLQNDITFSGFIDNDTDKYNAYNNADVFILPSHTENFGHVVAEALSCRVPVITTRGTPWSLLEQYNCGWWVENTAASLASALQTAVSLTDDERHAMGSRGRDMLSKEFSWPSIAAQMYSVYQWLLTGENKPACIYT